MKALIHNVPLLITIIKSAAVPKVRTLISKYPSAIFLLITEGIRRISK